MNLRTENTTVEEIVSFKVTTTFLFTKEQMESEETFTIKELFEAVQPKQEEKQDDSRIVNIIKANINHQPEHILQLVRQSEGNEGRQIVDQDVKELIANLQG